MAEDVITDEVETIRDESSASIKKRRNKRSQSRKKPEHKKRSGRGVARPFPAGSFADSLTFAREMFALGSGQPVRRLTLFDHLGKAPESSASRVLITNANKYGLITGGYQADHLELTDDGRKVVDEATPAREQARTKVKLAVTDLAPFQRLYERFTNARLPAKAVLMDALKEFAVPGEYVEEGVDTFIVNLRFLGLLQTLSGADRIVTLEHLLDSIPAISTSTSLSTSASPEGRSVITQEHAAFETTCFYITPIGDEGSEARKHSDLFLGNIVEPALSAFGLKVIRADAIDKPGIITRQIIEYLLRSRLVIADLSFHNPNVFYELALRHAVRLPIVQVIRASDAIPFDVHQMRTVVIDNRDIYALVPKIETYRSEIATQVRSALEASAEVDTPISIYFPNFRVTA
jgi:hypothetical protein